MEDQLIAEYQDLEAQIKQIKTRQSEIAVEYLKSHKIELLDTLRKGAIRFFEANGEFSNYLPAIDQICAGLTCGPVFENASYIDKYQQYHTYETVYYHWHDKPIVWAYDPEDQFYRNGLVVADSWLYDPFEGLPSWWRTDPSIHNLKDEQLIHRLQTNGSTDLIKELESHPKELWLAILFSLDAEWRGEETIIKNYYHYDPKYATMSDAEVSA